MKQPEDSQRSRVLVIIPAFNEEQSVGQVVSQVRQSNPYADVLVVNDGSTDDTQQVAEAAGAMVATLPFNLGVGGAMRTGFVFALGHGYDIAVQVDADGQHDPSEVQSLVEGLNGADVVVGARFAGKGDYKARGPRRWAMRFLAAVLSRIADTTLTDTTSGFRASNHRALKVFARHYPAEYLGDTVEALVIAARAGLVIRQVPVAMRPRAVGESTQSIRQAAFYLVRVCLAVVFALSRPPSSY